MSKKYSVFVSSTYVDLKEERDTVIRQIMEMDCIPIGMEAFPAADDEQLEFIKTLISDCDYYVVIVGGRYGSVDDEGISYTEREFEFALKLGVPVIAMLHESPSSLPVDKTDASQEELEKFRNRLSDKRLAKFWNDKYQLSSLVSSAIHNAIKTKPRPGWVRGDQKDSPELLLKIKELEEKLVKEEKSPDTLIQQTITEMQKKESFEVGGFKYEYSLIDLWPQIFKFCNADFPSETIYGAVAHFLSQNNKYHDGQSEFERYRIILTDKATIQQSVLDLKLINIEIEHIKNARTTYWRKTKLGTDIYNYLINNKNC